MARQVRYGCPGASQILKGPHAKALHVAHNAQMDAIASRRPAKARQYAEELNIPRVHEPMTTCSPPPSSTSCSSRCR